MPYEKAERLAGALAFQAYEGEFAFPDAADLLARGFQVHAALLDETLNRCLARILRATIFVGVAAHLSTQETLRAAFGDYPGYPAVLCLFGNRQDIADLQIVLQIVPVDMLQDSSQTAGLRVQAQTRAQGLFLPVRSRRQVQLNDIRKADAYIRAFHGRQGQMQAGKKNAHQLRDRKLRIGTNAEIDIMIHDQLTSPKIPPRISTAIT